MNRFSRNMFGSCLFSAAALAPGGSATARADEKPAAAKPVAAKVEAPAAPARPSVPEPPKPAVELEQIGFLVGTFNCEGGRPQPFPTPELKYKSRFVSKVGLDKYFIGYTSSQIKSKELPLPSVREGHFGWDAGLKRFVYGGSDNSGVAFLLRAEVPTSDQFVFKGTASPLLVRHVPVMWTFAKTDKGFEVEVQLTNGDGDLAKYAHETCVKTGK